MAPITHANIGNLAFILRGANLDMDKAKACKGLMRICCLGGSGA